MRRQRLLTGAIALSMVGLLPLGVAAQTENDETASGTSGSAGEVTSMGNLVYATGRADDPKELTLTLHLPAESEDAPMVIDAGWALTLGDGRGTGRSLAKQGVTVFRVMTPDRWHAEVLVDADPTAYRAMVEAVACAVRFARGSEYGSETAPLVLTGLSRHGATASHVALAGESFDQLWEEYADSMAGPPAQYDCTISEASTRVDGFVGVAGPYDLVVGYDGTSYDSPFARDFLLEHQPDLWEMFWGTVGLHPELRVRLLHGDADDVIPLQSSVVFEDVLAEAGYDVELVEFEGGHVVPYDLVEETLMELLQ